MANKTSTVTRAQALLAGVLKYFAGQTSLTLDSTTYTLTQITTALGLLVTLRSDVDAAKATLSAKIAAEKAQAPAVISLMAALTAYVKATQGASPDVLAGFGLKPKKAATPLTPEQKVVAVAKRKSTRLERGTTGKKEKMAIHGSDFTVAVNAVPASLPVVTTPAAPGNGGSGTSHGA